MAKLRASVFVLVPLAVAALGSGAAPPLLAKTHLVEIPAVVVDDQGDPSLVSNAKISKFKRMDRRSVLRPSKPWMPVTPRRRMPGWSSCCSAETPNWSKKWPVGLFPE